MFISKSTNIVPIFNGDVLYSLVYGCNPTLNDKQKRHMQDPYPVLTTIMSPLNMLLLNVVMYKKLNIFKFMSKNVLKLSIFSR